MQIFSTRAPWFAAAMTAFFLASPVLAADNKDELERVSRSIEVLQQLMAAPDDAIPEHILERAEAIVVIPTLVKGGFVLGAEHGKGVMSISEPHEGHVDRPELRRRDRRDRRLAGRCAGGGPGPARVQMSKANTQNVDIDGDGKADISVTALPKEDGEKKPKAKVVKPEVPDGTLAPDANQLGDFQKQKADVHYKIVIQSTNDPNEVKRVFVGVNGVPYTILRDVPGVVPKCVLTTLNDAKGTRYRDGPKGPLGKVNKVAYTAQSYPFQVLAEVQPDDVEAERAKIKDEFGL